jgi:hypothetical protein
MISQSNRTGILLRRGKDTRSAHRKKDMQGQRQKVAFCKHRREVSRKP